MQNLQGKVAIVTGASKGIGAAIAAAFGAAGASVVVNYSSSRVGAEKVVQQITDSGQKAVAVQADMSKADNIETLFRAAHDAFGRLDILVNNAGVYNFAPIEAIDAGEFHREFDLNVLGPLLAIQHAIKQMSEGGSIINVSSVVGVNPAPNSAIYSATKAALDSITKTAAKELGGKKIRVNSVLPGATRTPGVESIEGFIEGMGKSLIDATPLGRMGEPEDIAGLVTFLASDQSAWITGEIIRVSGGLQ